MAERQFDLEVDVSELVGIAEGLGSLGAQGLAGIAAAAVNEVTLRFDEKQRAAQIADINLPRSYVDRKTQTVLATPSEARATITTAGDLTVMDRYPIQTLRDPSRLDRRGHRLGQRQAGVRVAIKPSAPVAEPQWFTMRLKNGNGTGVFVRTSAGKVKHLYGPSPYSLFRHQVNLGEPALLDDLEATGAQALADAIEKAIA